jgi:hypothetical protein
MYVFLTFCTGLFSADELAFLPFGFLGGTFSTRLMDLLLNPGDSELSVSRLSCCRCSDGSGYDAPRNLWENQKPKAKPATREQKHVPINAPVKVWAEYTTGVTVTPVIRLRQKFEDTEHHDLFFARDIRVDSYFRVAGNGAGKLKQQKKCKRNKYKNRNKCNNEDVIDF